MMNAGRGRCCMALLKRESITSSSLIVINRKATLSTLIVPVFYCCSAPFPSTCYSRQPLRAFPPQRFCQDDDGTPIGTAVQKRLRTMRGDGPVIVASSSLMPVRFVTPAANLGHYLL